MANRKAKNPGNVAGPFYVDDTCIDCDLCRETAPALFRRDEELGLSIVFHQPETPEEWQQARAALKSCPTETIGEDGEEE
jgi:ferredoxin